jgi:adenosylhomocysteine nucleosidase
MGVMRRLGVITGLLAEARLLKSFIEAKTPEILVASAAGGEQARVRHAAQELCYRGVEGLISFGLAGGLAPQLRTGTLVVATRVISPAGRELDVIDRNWADRLWRSLGAMLSTPVYLAPIVTNMTPVAAVAEKAGLYQKQGAYAVDMESAAAAAVAAECGLSFVALRAIADTARHALPPAALLAQRQDGSIDINAVMKAVRKQPAQLPALCRLGWESARAMASLQAAADVSGGRFFFE